MKRRIIQTMIHKPKFPLHLFFAIGFLVMRLDVQSQVVRSGTDGNLDQAASWTGAVVPGSTDIARWQSGSSTATQTVGAGVSFLGISITNPGANVTIGSGTGSLTLGTSGIDLSASSNRTLTINAAVILSGNQTWTTSSSFTDNTAQITIGSGVISGNGRLTIAGSGGGGEFVRINSASTYSGGFQLDSGGAFKVGVTSVVAGGNVTSGAFGTGAVVINGGILFGGGDTAAPGYTLNGDFAVNVGASGGANARLSFGGPIDLATGTRTLTLGRSTTFANAVASGNESFRFISIANGPTVSVSNGTIRFVGDASTNGSTAVVSVALGSATNFTSNAGLTIGSNVVTILGTSSALPSGTNAPEVSVEAGGYLNLSSGNNTYNANIAGLNGSGTVTNLDLDGGSTATLTLGNNDKGGSFSGVIADGASLNATTGLTVPTNSLVAITKIGSGTQVLSGNNSYDGLTTVSGGTLTLSGDNSGAAGGVQLNAATLNINSATALGTGTLTINNDLAVIDNTSGGALTLSTNNPINFLQDLTFGGSQNLNFGTGAVSSSLPITITLNGSGRTLTFGGTWSNTNETSSTLTVNGSGNTLVLGAINIAPGSVNRNFTIRGTGNVVVNGVIANGGTATASGITKNDAGTLTLAGANTYAGDTTITAGVVNLNHTNAVQNSTVIVNAAGGLTFSAGIGTFNAGGLAANTAGNLVLTDAAAQGVNLAVGSNQANTTVSSLISGSGSLTKNGSGSLQLTGDNTYSGGTTVNGGTILLGISSTVTSGSVTSGPLGTGNLSLGSGATLAASSTGVGRTLAAPQVNLNGDITVGTFTTLGSTGTARVVLSGAIDLGSTNATRRITLTNFAAGTGSGTNNEQLQFATTNGLATTVQDGTLELAAGNNVQANQTASVNFASAVSFINNAGLIIGERVRTFGNNNYLGTGTNAAALTVQAGGFLDMSNGGTTSRNLEVFSLSGAGTIYNGDTDGLAGTAVLTVSGSASTTFSGTIQDGSVAGSVVGLVKSGSGRLTLSGNNSYSLTTQVTGGQLQVGVNGSGQTGTGNVSVSTASTILGTGTVRGTQFIAQSGSSVHAGDGTLQTDYGTLNFAPLSGSGSFDFQSGSTTFLGIDSNGVSDLLNFSGTGSNTLLFNGNLTVGPSSFTPTSPLTFNLLDWSGLASAPTFASRFLAGSYAGLIAGNGDDNLGLNLPDVSSTIFRWDISQFITNGTITLVIPEPSRMFLLILGAMVLLTRRSRQF